MHSDVLNLHQPGLLSLTEVTHSSNAGETLSLNKGLHRMPDQIPADPAYKRPTLLLQSDS